MSYRIGGRVAVGILSARHDVVGVVIADVVANNVSSVGRDVRVRHSGRRIIVGGVAESLDVEILIVEGQEEDADEEGEEHDNRGQFVIPRLLGVDADQPNGH